MPKKIKFKKYFSVLFLMLGPLLQTACSVVQPVHEALPPETLGPWGFRLGLVTGSVPDIAPNLNTPPLDTASYSSVLQGLRFDVGLGQDFELDDDAYVGGVTGGNSIALKWQMLGNTLFQTKKGDSTLSLVLRYNSGSATGLTSGTLFQNNDNNMDLNVYSTDASLIYAYRFLDSFGGYIGAKDINGTVNASYHSVQNGPVTSTASKTFSAYGSLAALYLSVLGKNGGVDIVLEWEMMCLPSTYSANTSWASNYTLSVGVPFHF